MRLRSSPLITLMLGTAAVAIAVGCARMPSPPLAVATNVWPGYAPLYLARDLGYLDPSTARMVEMPSTSVAMEAMRDDSIDVAALTLDEALTLADEGLDVRVVLVTDISNGADAIVATTGIQDIADLRGRRVGVETGALGAYVLTRALDRAGMRPTDVQVVNVSIDEQEEAFKGTGADAVDAVVTFEPVKSKLVASGGVVVFDSADIPGEIVDVLVVRAATLRDRRGDIDAVLAAWYRALDYARVHPQDANRRMAHIQGTAIIAFEASMGTLSVAGRAENARLLEGDRPVLLATAERLAAVMTASRLMRHEASARILFGLEPTGTTSP